MPAFHVLNVQPNGHRQIQVLVRKSEANPDGLYLVNVNHLAVGTEEGQDAEGNPILVPVAKSWEETCEQVAAQVVASLGEP
jgi:hypothetical protein